MNWPLTIGTALLTGLIALFTAGFVANACATWFNVSTREGAAGYFVVFTALLGGVAGLAIGGITTGVLTSQGDAGFLKCAGISLGIVFGIALFAIGLSYLSADIPPKLDGHELMLEVEFRLPANQPVAPDEKWEVRLGSMEGHQQRASWSGAIKTEAARHESARRILPGSVHLFTQRGDRLVHLMNHSDYIASFLVPLPSRPDARFESWSEWLPRQSPDGTAWPDTKTSYRFRIQKMLPTPPPPDPAEVEAAEFAKLKPDAPLTNWLKFLEHDSPPDRVKAVMAIVDARPLELVALIRNASENDREAALRAVPHVAVITVELRDALLAEAKLITTEILRGHELKPEDANFHQVRMDLASRFNHWKYAWWSVAQRLGADVRPPVQEILEAANARGSSTAFDEIVINAKAILENALPTKGEVSGR